MGGTINRSPTSATATLTPSLLDSYQAFVSKRSQDLQASAAGYSNDQPLASSSSTIGQILNIATYVPATTQRYSIGRGSDQPTFAIISRVAPSGVDPSLGNLTTVLTEFSNTKLRQVSPHFVIGLGGEIVQMVDLGDSALYLNGTYPQPSPISAAQTLDNIIDSVIRFTAANEGGVGGYSTFNPNDNGHGVSYGFIQFNQTVGSLPQLLQAMQAANPTKFSTIFGSVAPQLINPDWVKANSLVGYKNQFQQAGLVPEFQLAQRKLARSQYWSSAASVAGQLNLQSQRAYAIFFDTCVQRGSAAAMNIAKQVSNVSDPTQKLSQYCQIADSVALSGDRRTHLLTDSRLSDVQLQLSFPPGVTSTSVSDSSSVIIMLEGLSGDPVTLNQRNATASVLRTLSDTYGIPVSSDRIFGADSVLQTTSNPGPNFNYVDLLSATLSLTKTDPNSVFQPTQAPTAQTVAATLQSLIGKLQVARAANNLQTLAILSAYDDAKNLARSNNVAQFTRAQHYAAGVTTNVVVQNVVGQDGAGTQDAGAGTEQTLPVPAYASDTINGLLYNWSTGLWSDGKSVGKVD